MAGSWPGLWISLILSCLIQVEEFKKTKKAQMCMHRKGAMEEDAVVHRHFSWGETK